MNPNQSCKTRKNDMVWRFTQTKKCNLGISTLYRLRSIATRPKHRFGLKRYTAILRFYGIDWDCIDGLGILKVPLLEFDALSNGQRCEFWRRAKHGFGVKRNTMSFLRFFFLIDWDWIDGLGNLKRRHLGILTLHRLGSVATACEARFCVTRYTMPFLRDWLGLDRRI